VSIFEAVFQEVVQSPGVVHDKYPLSVFQMMLRILYDVVDEHDDMEEDGEDEHEARDLSKSFISPSPTRQGGLFLSSSRTNFQR
jgi:hypothetical protein